VAGTSAAMAATLAASLSQPTGGVSPTVPEDSVLFARAPAELATAMPPTGGALLRSVPAPCVFELQSGCSGGSWCA
jgi:hypothetical protein